MATLRVFLKDTLCCQRTVYMGVMQPSSFIRASCHACYQRSILRTMSVAYSDSHPTLYVVSPWWNRSGSMLFDQQRTGLALPWTTYRVGGLSECDTLMVLRIDLCLLWYVPFYHLLDKGNHGAWWAKNVPTKDWFPAAIEWKASKRSSL